MRARFGPPLLPVNTHQINRRTALDKFDSEDVASKAAPYRMNEGRVSFIQCGVNWV